MASDFDQEDVLDKWCLAFHESNYKECLRIAMKAYADAERYGSKVDQTLIIKLIKSSAMLFDGEFKFQQADSLPLVCSFCRSVVGKKQAVAGLDAVICSDCIKMMSGIIK